MVSLRKLSTYASSLALLANCALPRTSHYCRENRIQSTQPTKEVSPFQEELPRNFPSQRQYGGLKAKLTNAQKESRYFGSKLGYLLCKIYPDLSDEGGREKLGKVLTFSFFTYLALC